MPTSDLMRLSNLYRSRMDKAISLFQAGLVLEADLPGNYLIKGSGKALYNVSLNSLECDCWDYRKVGGQCKHLLAATIQQTMIRQVKA